MPSVLDIGHGQIRQGLHEFLACVVPAFAQAHYFPPQVAALVSRAEIRKDRKSNATALPLRADRLSVACVASDWLLRTSGKGPATHLLRISGQRAKRTGGAGRRDNTVTVITPKLPIHKMASSEVQPGFPPETRSTTTPTVKTATTQPPSCLLTSTECTKVEQGEETTPSPS
ncbi:unnamed protein product [Gadus morhua 'NCC']